MGVQVSWLDRPDATIEHHEMPGHFEPFPQPQEKVSLLEGATDSTITGGTFNAAGRDIVNTTTIKTVNNIIINFLDGKPLSDADILEWLSAINYRAIQMDNFEKVTPETGLWFLQSEIFLQWLLSQEGILWGTGMPGSGKTLLASIVINHIQAHAKLRGPKIALAFAYCRYTSPMPVQQILSALVRQLLERYPFLLPLVQPLYDEHRREKTKPSKNQLLDLLRDISKVFDTLYCVLDGLDEATEDDQFMLLDALSSVKANFFITSRPLESLRSLLPNARFFTIVAHDEDIQKLIDQKIKQSPRLNGMLDTQAEGLSHRETIITKITQKAGGMFLHAALQVEALQHSINLRHALTSLDQLPSSIEDMYARTMERIDMQPRASSELARRVLTWVVFARSLLTMDDLRIALAVNITDQPIPPASEIIDPLALVDANTLLSVCCGLLTVESLSGNVRLVHFTALDYLQRKLCSPKTELILGKTCIRRMMCEGLFDYPTFSEWFQDSPEAFSGGTVTHLFPESSNLLLVTYALTYWTEHVKACFTLDDAGQTDILPDVVQFILHFPNVCDVAKFAPPDPFISIITLAPPGASSPSEVSTPSSSTPIHPSPQSGFPSLVAAICNLISRLEYTPGFDINRTSTPGHGASTAIVFAVDRGSIQIVRRLLTFPDIDINPGNDGYLPLARALENGRVDIANIILDHMLHVGIQQMPSGGAPLIKAAMRAGSEKILRRLLSLPQMDVNQASGSSNSTPLLIAVAKGLGGIVAVLLEHPEIDINQRDKLGWTALLLAVEDKFNSIAYQLLERADLDPNIAGPRGGCTALMTAAWADNVEITGRLVEHPRIQINAVDEAGQTALAHALHCGHLEVAKAILASPGVNINLERPSDGLIPLMMGAMLTESAASGLFPLLLQYPGIDVNKQMEDGVTALILAAYHGHTSVVRLLLEAPDIDPNSKTNEGATALEFARSRGHDEIVEQLLSVE